METNTEKNMADKESRGVIMFNRGPNMVIRALVALYSLRKHYNGNISFYVEEPTPPELDEALKYFHINEGIYNAINARDNLEAHQEFLLAIERAIELNSVD